MSNQAIHSEVRPSYKQTKLGWIPEEWKVVNLGDLFKLSSGKGKPKDVSDHKDDIYRYPIYGGNGIMAYSSESFESGEKILIGRVGEYCGITRKINGYYWITDNALYTSEFFEKVDIDHLTFKLQYINLSLLRNKGGQPLISQKPIYSKCISLPPLSEQQKIAQILSTWDQAITKTEELIKQKQKRKQGLMQQLLTGKRRFMEFRNDDDRKKLLRIPKGLKNLYGGTIPYNWNQTKLADLASIKYGISTPINRALNNGTFIISLPNVNVEGELLLDDVPYIESEKVKNEDFLAYGDLLFNWRNGSAKHIGKTAFFDLKEKYTHVGFLLRIRINDKLDPFYLYTFLNFIRRRGYFTKSKVQVNNSFNKEELSELEVVFPTEKEQQKIVSVLSSADQEIKSLQNQLAKLKEQKKGLMQKFLTGEVRVKIDETL